MKASIDLATWALAESRMPSLTVRGVEIRERCLTEALADAAARRSADICQRPAADLAERPRVLRDRIERGQRQGVEDLRQRPGDRLGDARRWTESKTS